MLRIGFQALINLKYKCPYCKAYEMSWYHHKTCHQMSFFVVIKAMDWSGCLDTFILFRHMACWMLTLDPGYISGPWLYIVLEKEKQELEK